MSTKNGLDENGTKLNGHYTRRSVLPVEEMELDDLDVDRPTSSVQQYVMISRAHDQLRSNFCCSHNSFLTTLLTDNSSLCFGVRNFLVYDVLLVDR